MSSKSITGFSGRIIFSPTVVRRCNRALSSPPHPQKLLGYPLHRENDCLLIDKTPPKNISSVLSCVYRVPRFPR